MSGRGGDHCVRGAGWWPRPSRWLALACLCPALLAAAEHLRPTLQHQKTVVMMADFAASEHYGRPAFDTQLCGEVLHRLLAALDANRLIFSRTDVDLYVGRQAAFCASLRGSPLDPVFVVFERYRAALAERTAFAAGLLEREWDFTTQQSFRPRDSGSPWAADAAALDELWQQRVKHELLSLLLAGRSEQQARRILRLRYEQLNRRGAELTADEAFGVFANAFLHALDPHSEYLLPPRPRGGQPAGTLEGIGVQLETDGDYVAIKRIFDGGAAERSGQLHAGDRIVAVGQGADGELTDVVGWTRAAVVDLIRGETGSTVRLQVLPKGAVLAAQPGIVSLQRDRIRLQALTTHGDCRGVANLRLCVITVPRFDIDYAAFGRGESDYAGTAADVLRLINQSRQSAPIDGLVLDLRGNPGGALLEAARLAGLFIDRGPIVQVRRSSGKTEIFADPLPGAVYAGPLVVLLDRYSASATEIFAAAIQDYARGSIVGEGSYGKGTVQESFNLNDMRDRRLGSFGNLSLTTGEYFRVTGESTQLAGVEPDVVLPAWPGAGDYGERYEPNPLPAERLTAVAFEPVEDALLLGPAVGDWYAERRRDDEAMNAVLAAAAAQRAVAADKGLSLQRQTRERGVAELATLDDQLDRALRASLDSLVARPAAEASSDQLWRDFVLNETLLLLAEAVHALHSADSPSP